MITAFVSGLTIDDVKVCTFNPNKQKAWKVLQGIDFEELVTANKTLNFFLNILDPSEEYVTIDSHQINAGIYGFQRMPTGIDSKNHKVIKLNDTAYYMWADVIAELADKYSITPCQFQAVVWTVYRDLVLERK